MGNHNEIDTFNASLLFQLNDNLPNWLDNARLANGKIIPKSGKQLREGIDENPYVKGFLVFENGSNLLKKLGEHRIIVGQQNPEFTKLQGNYSDKRLRLEKAFVGYVRKSLDRESAYVINREESKVALVEEFNNSIPLEEGFERFLPHDFLAKDGKVSLDRIGKKTRNAVRLGKYYPDAKSYQLKSTPRGNAGLGVVAKFGEDGLERTVHIEYIPGQNLPYINLSAYYGRFELVAIDRRYKRDDKNERGIVCVSQSYLDVSKILPVSLDRSFVNA